MRAHAVAVALSICAATLVARSQSRPATGGQSAPDVKRIEYWGTAGTMAVEGSPRTLTKFRVSINYAVPGMRVDFMHDGQRTIHVVADKYAWNEDTPGGK